MFYLKIVCSVDAIQQKIPPRRLNLSDIAIVEPMQNLVGKSIAQGMGAVNISYILATIQQSDMS
jgi:hypothetical protein